MSMRMLPDGLASEAQGDGCLSATTHVGPKGRCIKSGVSTEAFAVDCYALHV